MTLYLMATCVTSAVLNTAEYLVALEALEGALQLASLSRIKSACAWSRSLICHE